MLALYLILMRPIDKLAQKDSLFNLPDVMNRNSKVLKLHLQYYFKIKIDHIHLAYA